MSGHGACISGVSLPDLNLVNAECRLVTEALTRTGSLVEAATLLGTNRHALRRLITKHDVQWWPYAQQQDRWHQAAATQPLRGRSRARR